MALICSSMHIVIYAFFSLSTYSSNDSLGGLVQQIVSLLSCGGCGMVYFCAAVGIWIL